MTRPDRWLGQTIVVASCAGVLLALPPPSSAVEWLPPVDVMPPVGDVVDEVNVAAGGAGGVTAAWWESEGRLLTASRPAGAPRFGDAELLAGRGGTPPDVAADPAGNVVVVWTEPSDSADGGWRVQAAWRPVGAGGFQSPMQVATSAAYLPSARVEVDSAARVTVVWAETGSRSVVRSSQWVIDGESWARPQDLTDPVDAVGNVATAIDGEGRVTAAWWAEQPGADGNVVQVATSPGGRFSPPEDLTGATPAQPDIAVGVNAAGDTAVAWEWDLGVDDEGADLGEVLQVAWRPADGTFAGEVDASPVVLDVSNPQVVVGPDGSVTAVYLHIALEPDRWRFHAEGVTTLGRGGEAFGAPVVFNAADADTWLLNVPKAEVGPDGAVTVVWPCHLSDGPSSTFCAARRESAGAFSAPYRLAPAWASNGDFDTAVDDEGNVTVVYHMPTTADRYQSRVLDAAGPRLGWAGPAAARSGAPVGLAVSASDRWSGPPSVSWDFGDGSTGTGASTTHVFTAAGAYRVRVSATDGGGNTSTLTRSLVVSDGVVPVLTRARLAPDRLPTGRGARLRLVASENARLTGVVQRRREGRWVRVGIKRWGVQAGANEETFYGRAAQQRLRGGRYRVHLSATDAAGNTSAVTTLRFRVDRP